MRKIMINLLKNALIATGVSLLFSSAVFANLKEVKEDSVIEPTHMQILQKEEPELYYRLNGISSEIAESDISLKSSQNINGVTIATKTQKIDLSNLKPTYGYTNGVFSQSESISKAINASKEDIQGMFNEMIIEATLSQPNSLENIMENSEITNTSDYLIARSNQDVLKLAQYYATLENNQLLKELIKLQKPS
jgi:hypothetical protein